MKAKTETCEICDRVAPEGKHPCRFEVCCACWRGVPCKGTGKVRAEITYMKEIGVW